MPLDPLTLLASTLLATPVAQQVPAAEPATTTGGPAVVAHDADFFAAARPMNALDMINRLPGFTLDDGAALRGYDGAAGNVLVNGKRASSKTDSLEDVLQRIPASAVLRIDLIRGGAPGIDMQGRAVVANLILKAQARIGGAIVLRQKAIDDGRKAPGVRLDLFGGDEALGWELSTSADRRDNNGLGEGERRRRDALTGTVERGEQRSRGMGDLYAVTGVVKGRMFGGEARANARVFQENYEGSEAYDQSGPAGGRERFKEDVDRQQAELGARFERRLGRLDLEAVALHQQKSEDQLSNFVGQQGRRDLFTLNRDTRESLARVHIKRNVGGLRLEMGGEGARNTLESRTRLQQGTDAIKLPAANVRVTEARGEGMISAFYARPRLNLEAALRYERSRVRSAGDVGLEKTLGFWKPRLSATWNARQDLQFRARLERSVGQLNFDDLVSSTNLNAGAVSAGNPDLDPERAWIAEGALEWRFWGRGVATLTASHASLKDVIDRAPISGGAVLFDGPANIGEGRRDVVSLDLSVPLDRLGISQAQLRASVSRRLSEVTDPTTGEARPISGLRPIEWSLNYTQDIPGKNLSVGVDIWSAWRETYYRFNQVDDRKILAWVQPFAEWKPSARLSLRAEIGNLTGRAFKVSRKFYSGRRGVAPLTVTEDRHPSYARTFQLSLRRTF